MDAKIDVEKGAEMMAKVVKNDAKMAADFSCFFPKCCFLENLVIPEEKHTF